MFQLPLFPFTAPASLSRPVSLPFPPFPASFPGFPRFQPAPPVPSGPPGFLPGPLPVLSTCFSLSPYGSLLWATAHPLSTRRLVELRLAPLPCLSTAMKQIAVRIQSPAKVRAAFGECAGDYAGESLRFWLGTAKSLHPVAEIPAGVRLVNAPVKFTGGNAWLAGTPRRVNQPKTKSRFQVRPLGWAVDWHQEAKARRARGEGHGWPVRIPLEALPLP